MIPTMTTLPPTGSVPRADFEKVPVVDVHRDNIDEHLAQLNGAIKQASFIAVDCELSGLGDRKKLNAPTIDDRYKNTGMVAKTRSIISLGLSMFRLVEEEKEDEVSSWSYNVQSYNLLLLCGEDYIVEPGSLQFLVEHGFDFQAQYSLGIPYLRGNDREEPAKKGEPKPARQKMREIFDQLVSARKPLVLHNGLIDLVFLYHNLWAALPSSLGTFVSDLTEMFPAGLYDTKYIAEFVSRTQASFLEFVFRKEQKTNVDKRRKRRPHVKLVFEEQEADVQWRLCGLEEEEDEREVCISYAQHGHCPQGRECVKSHNIDLALREKNLEQEKKRRKRKHEEEDSDGVQVVDTSDRTGESCVRKTAPKTSNSGGHRAGYDAFMTGFSFATFLVHQTQLPNQPVNFEAKNIKAEKLVNRIYLVSKDFPLLVQRSTFAKCSVQHDLKMKRLGLCDEDPPIIIL